MSYQPEDENVDPTVSKSSHVELTNCIVKKKKKKDKNVTTNAPPVAYI